MIPSKVALSIFVCGVAISPFSVNAQSQEDVSSLLSKATAAVQAANPEYRSDFISGGVKCVGVIPKSAKTSAGSSESEGLVTCQTRGKWSSPFMVRATPKNGFTLGGISNGLKKRDEDIVFLTYGDRYSSENQIDGMTLKNGEDSQVLSVGDQASRISNSTIAITADRSNQIPNEWSSSSQTQSFLEGVSDLADRQSERPKAGPYRPPPPKIGLPAKGPPTTSTGYMPRVTGTNVLVSGETEPSGYGLYSYALIGHSPSDNELPVYKAFFQALLAQPTSNNLAKTIPLIRINITEVPTTKRPNHWDTESVDERVSFVMANYDYARAAGILACLPQRTRPGPVIVSVLVPIDVSKRPNPVLVEDLTLAEPRLMTSNVEYFVDQASKDQFWEESTLSSMCLKLRNALEVAAVGLGMSKEAVNGWINLLSGK